MPTLEYTISKEIAHAIAVGLYQRVGAYVATAKRETPDDYERFKAAYLARQQSAQASAPTKRRHTRKDRTTSR